MRCYSSLVVCTMPRHRPVRTLINRRWLSVVCVMGNKNSLELQYMRKQESAFFGEESFSNKAKAME